MKQREGMKKYMSGFRHTCRFTSIQMYNIWNSLAGRILRIENYLFSKILIFGKRCLADGELGARLKRIFVFCRCNYSHQYVEWISWQIIKSKWYIYSARTVDFCRILYFICTLWGLRRWGKENNVSIMEPA